MNSAIVIPARLDSTRMEAKVLQKLKNKIVLQHVFDNLNESEILDRIIIATDHQLIYETANAFGAECIMTSDLHRSGTERVAEVAQNLEVDIIINVQGDEVFIQPFHIEMMLKAFEENQDCEIITLYERGNDIAVYNNPNDVKLVCNGFGDAIYFSRSPIPYFRSDEPIAFKKHIGVYGFRKEALLALVSSPSSQLEQTEKLEQLRWLENGFRIKVIEVPQGLIGIDTIEDLKKAERRLD